MFDILIIGAGVVGASIARELSKYELKVGIIEREPDVCMGASKANSAIVHGGYAESSNTFKGKICYKGRVKFEQLNEELNFGYKKLGSLLLGENEDLDKLKSLEINGIKNGLNDLKIITSKEIRKLEPNIKESFEYALYCEGAGVCSPFEYTIALIENALDNGVFLFLNENVIDIENKEYFTIKTEKDTYRSKIIINCSGTSSEKISKMIGANDFSISYRSGEYLVFDKTEGDKINSVLFQMPTKLGKGVLVSKTVYGNLIIGPDALDEKSEKFETNEDRLVEIFEKSKLISNRIDPNKIIRTFAGVRVISDNDDFIIKESSVKNFINVSGIQSPGLTSSPAIAEYVLNILKNKGIKLNKKEDFNPYREGFGNYKKKHYDKEELICICEEKNDIDIMSCFNKKIPTNTIDGIKRRVRAGMGQCQGRRCKIKIKKLLDKNNINIDYRTDIEVKGIKRVDRFKLIKKLISNS
ncbi:FAD-dependent oxidoreductase [Miniphocaeibacter massiliensis]|uniref:FAD-dependent oxidoreductase n=1 Tax=Miniphocaeibacter massiliensis TaxID=2041841 RepID=UPI000C071CE7|nr:FAD-dependent oxidoreductase [Miniphocaeibacter massiliensis]